MKIVDRIRYYDYDELWPKLTTKKVIIPVCVLLVLLGGYIGAKPFMETKTHEAKVAKMQTDVKNLKEQVKDLEEKTAAQKELIGKQTFSAVQVGDHVASAQNDYMARYWFKKDEKKDAAQIAKRLQVDFINPTIDDVKPWAIGSTGSDLGGRSASARWTFETRYTMHDEKIQSLWVLRDESTGVKYAFVEAEYDGNEKKFGPIKLTYTKAGAERVKPTKEVEEVIMEQLKRGGAA